MKLFGISGLFLAVVALSGLVYLSGYAVSPASAPRNQAAITLADTYLDQQVFLPLIYFPDEPVQIPTQGWPMLAANPQRSSWSLEEVRGDLYLDWYRPIEPYIPYKVQPIAAGGKIFVSTASGLYAFQASDGKLAWVYPTQVPLGHSPTIATINGRSIAYVGGYDRIVHAVDANTGQPIPGYEPHIAGAGFETNPLVVNGTLYAGNRDGFFYALDALSGALKWKYKTGGPILYSAAYKDGVVYFAANDAHAYAVKAANGLLVWRSEALPGSGFHSYWPVIYTDPAAGKDYVIFTGGENYMQLALSLTTEETNTLFSDIPLGELVGPTSTSVQGQWAPGTVVVDASKLSNYYQNRPDRRTVFVLDAATGTEYTFDANRDGQPEYAPFTWSGVTQSGSKYPPLINGLDGVYYQSTAYISFGWVSRGGPVGWKFGTPYISRVEGSEVGHASDEPLAYSSGGKIIYWSLCCDREAGGMDVTIPFGQPGRAWKYYDYNLARNELAPGYQQMYNAGDPTAYNDMNGWQLYSGKNQSKNGIYGKHGTTQTPPIPYQGRLYQLKGNALLVFSPSGTEPKTPLPLAGIVLDQNDSASPTKTELGQRLEAEVHKMLSAGHLRPGYHTAGLVDLFGYGWYTDERELGEIFDYFQNPADTVYTLLLAYPHLSAATQSQVLTYLEANYGPGSPYDFTRIVHIGWGSGAAREVFEIPPEVKALWGQPYKSPLEPSTQPICSSCGYWQRFPPFSFYSAWKYAQVVGNGDPDFAREIFDRLSQKLEPPLSESVFLHKPYWHNLYLAGYQGYLELQKLAGYPQDQAVLANYQAMLDLRADQFSKDTPYPPIYDTGGPQESYNNNLAVARNFMFLTPELGNHLRQNIFAQVQTAVSEYEYVAPYWFVTRFDDSYGEGTFQPLYTSPALFQAKAYILGQPYEELVKWLDVPAFQQGDLFYIQNLVAALNAPQNP